MPKYLSTGVKLGNANTWSALQTFSAGLTVSGGNFTFGANSRLAGSYAGGSIWASLDASGNETGAAFLAEHYYGRSSGASTLHWNGTTQQLKLGNGGAIGFTSATAATGTPDTLILRDAANTLAQRNGTNAQESRIYATYTSATQQHYMAFKTAKTTLSAVSGATVTATNLIPGGAFVVGVTTRVNTGLGVSLGTTGYQVGDGTDADRWGAITGTAAGTDSDNTDATANPTGAFTAANNVVITAVGGNFDGTGAIEVAVMYLIAVAE